MTVTPGSGFHGDAARLPLARPITGIATTATGKGYWLVAADGGVFSYGDARFYGSMVGIHLNAPVVGIASTKDGHGYWLVASDGGVFTFGDATFWGSLGGTGLTDVIGLAPTPSGNGYWILRNNGGSYQDCSYPGCYSHPGFVAGPSVANFGDARDLPPGFCVPGYDAKPACDVDFMHDPVVAIVANPVAQGYLVLRATVGHSGFAGALPHV